MLGQDGEAVFIEGEDEYGDVFQEEEYIQLEDGSFIPADQHSMIPQVISNFNAVVGVAAADTRSKKRCSRLWSPQQISYFCRPRDPLSRRCYNKYEWLQLLSK